MQKCIESKVRLIFAVLRLALTVEAGLRWIFEVSNIFSWLYRVKVSHLRFLSRQDGSSPSENCSKEFLRHYLRLSRLTASPKSRKLP